MGKKGVHLTLPERLLLPGAWWGDLGVLVKSLKSLSPLSDIVLVSMELKNKRSFYCMSLTPSTRSPPQPNPTHVFNSP